MSSTSFWIRTTVLVTMIALLVLLIVQISRKKKSAQEENENENETFMDSGVMHGSYDESHRLVGDEEQYIGKQPEGNRDKGVTNAFEMTPELKNLYARTNENPEKPEEVNPFVTDDLDTYESISDMNTEHKIPKNPFPSDTVMPEDLLPKEGAANSKWSQSNPPVSGSIMDQNFLQPGVNFGIDTKGSTMKNPNYSLRSEPPVSKIPGLSPWLNSEWEQDLNRKTFEIGEC